MGQALALGGLEASASFFLEDGHREGCQTSLEPRCDQEAQARHVKSHVERCLASPALFPTPQMTPGHVSEEAIFCVPAPTDTRWSRRTTSLSLTRTVE